jgi:hypothetical protein
LEKTWEVSQEEKENEHSEECFNAFSQEAKEAATLKIAREEATE